MKKIFKFLFLFVFAFNLLLSTVPSSASTPKGASNYTYTYSFWSEEVPMPDAYYISNTFMGHDFGIGNFRNPRGIHVSGNYIYVCDTGNNRVVIIEYIGSTDTYELANVIDHVYIDPADAPVEASGTSDSDDDDYDSEENDHEIAIIEDENDDNPTTGDVSQDEEPVDDEDENIEEPADDDADDENVNQEEQNEDVNDTNGEEENDDENTDNETQNEDDENETEALENGLPLYNEDGLLLTFLRSPHDVFVTRNGEILIADTDNQRVIRLDSNYNYINSILQPDDATVEQSVEFLPEKFVVDFANRVFVQVRNVNRGLMEFSIDGNFMGYMGANRVTVNIIDRFWKAIATEAQRDRMELFVPTEYNNVAIDHLGFLYTTLSTFRGHPSEADPVRRLNAIGNDILVRNGYDTPYGDWHWNNVGGAIGPTRFVDVIPFENDSYACLDRIRGRIFVYDFQGNMLYVFGGIGNKEGYFLNAASMDSMGYDIFVVDSRSGVITRFNLTEYGKYINEAMNYYYNGLYDDSALMWDEVLKLNGNYDLAYIGKGRAALRNEEYAEAMEFYKTKYDQENYGKAFSLYRKEWIEERVVSLIIIVISLYAAVKVLGFVIRRHRRNKGGN